MTLYRINPKADDRDVFHAVSTDPGGEPALVVAEPTDRVCITHGDCLFDLDYVSDGCETVDVVRVTP